MISKLRLGTLGLATFLLLCLSLFSIAVIKVTSKRNLGKKRFNLPYRLQSMIEGSQGRNLKQKSWKNAAEWHTSRLTLALLSLNSSDLST